MNGPGHRHVSRGAGLDDLDDRDDRDELSLADACDEDLLAAHGAGDPDAFGELFRRHKDRMWAVAVRTCGDREMAADAVQDGFLTAFRRADSFRNGAGATPR